MKYLVLPPHRPGRVATRQLNKTIKALLRHRVDLVLKAGLSWLCWKTSVINKWTGSGWHDRLERRSSIDRFEWRAMMEKCNYPGLLSGKTPDPGYNIHVYRLQTKSQTSAAQLRRHNKHGDDVERPPSRAIDRLFDPHRMQYTHTSHVTTTIFTLTQSRTFVAQMTRGCYAMNVQRHLSWMWREILLRWTIKNKTCDWQQRQKKGRKKTHNLSSDHALHLNNTTFT